MKNLIATIGFALFGAIGSLWAFESESFVRGAQNECWWEWGGSQEKYWFCGKQSTHDGKYSCAGNRCVSGEVCSEYYSLGIGAIGDTFSHNERNFVCCNGFTSGDENVGRWIEYTDASYQQYSVKELYEKDEDGSDKLDDNGNKIKIGECTMIANPCWNAGWHEDRYILLDCTEPDEHICIEGTILRKIFNDKHEEQEGRCVTPCSSANEGYESYNGDTCVTCNKTANQGKDTYGTCVFCNSDEFFMIDNKYGTGNNARDCAGSECCVKKNTMPVAMHSALEWCYRCDQDKDLWRRCLSGGLDDDDFGRCSVSTQIPDNLKVNLHL
ncbi:MAG: hypothetical protein J5611_01795 [Alphaproteobacteria bacterium]|nr:hypothetical protein [Alphaproteobacteria bacterium]